MARRNPMGYKDAVRLLAQDDSVLINALDQVLGLGLLAATAINPAGALPFFDMKDELIAQLRKLVGGLKERARNSGRIEYEQLLAAAHAVIVLTAYTEVLAEQVKKLDGGDKLRRELRQWEPSAGTPRTPRKFRRRQFVEWADRSIIRPPGPTRSLEDVIEDLDKTYRELSAQALDYISDLRSWNDLLHSQQRKIEEALTVRVPRLAVSRYKEHFMRLAVQIPEFMTWALLNEGAATRAKVRALLVTRNAEMEALVAEFDKALKRIEAKIEAERAALADLPSVLAEMLSVTAPSRRNVARAVAECHLIHQLVLKKPMLEPRLSGELEMISFPTSLAGYVNPNYRITRTQRSDEGRLLALDDMWREKSIRGELGGFLAGYLRSEDATERPLLVLGDPGSGKSLLSKILAARLPPQEFAVVRVELRHVRFSQDISDQIDLELHRQTNNRYHLQDLTDERGEITRIIIMDGLDELLQLSPREGLGRYLEWLADFQELESELGHPVIAIATARTVVMDRIYVPSRIVVIKLEDFSQDQILSWLKAWNQQNSEYFASRGLRRLDPETIMRQHHLARQPLLLALLALYDAEQNALRNAANLSQAELYERIFHRYLEREVEKSVLPVRKTEQEALIEQRFRELSTIAIGMLNRGRRFITRHEVVEDFNAIEVSRTASDAGLTNVDDAVGQFFFLYRAQALQEESVPVEGYEFIHGTFGEFLAARIIARQLARASEVVRDAPPWDRGQAELHARSLLAPYLARRPLAGEEQVLLYLEDIMGTLVEARRPAALAIAAHIPTLLKVGVSKGDGYDVDRGHLDRLATLTLNIVVASLHTANAALPLSAFCEDSQESILQWRRLTTLWQTHLAIDDWDRVLSSFVLSDSGELDLSRREGHYERQVSFQGDVADPHLRRIIQTGWLTGDQQLGAAALVWSWAVAASMPYGEGRSANVGAIIARAFFSLVPRNASPAATEQALERLNASDRNGLEPIVGGPIRWPDEMLTNIASYLIEADKTLNDIAALIGVIEELDKRGRRGSAPLARKLLRLMPADAVAQPIPPADIAAIVSLSRRHQMPELLTRCSSADWLTSRAIDWLTIEDITWIIQSRLLPPDELEKLCMKVKADVRFRREIDRATMLLAEELRLFDCRQRKELLWL
jgi:hypothetical protein